MCGIIAGLCQRNVIPVLLSGLKDLEYRGYDSAGVAVIDNKQQKLQLQKQKGKVSQLIAELQINPIAGNVGIAHTRWATHGSPTQKNAHPHIIGNRIAIVHNGIIENHAELKQHLVGLHRDYDLVSDTDTEIITALIYEKVKETNCLLTALRAVVPMLQGAYALCAIDIKSPNQIIAVRSGCPLAVGIGVGEHFIASDVLAMQQVADKFIFLEEGDIGQITSEACVIYDVQGNQIERAMVSKQEEHRAICRDGFRHFMQKEIFEQPKAIEETLSGRLSDDHIIEEAFGLTAKKNFYQAQAVQIVACGTSYYAGLVARQWLEEVANIPCHVEVASEFRYRRRVVLNNTLLVTISQSGETADTLAALRAVQAQSDQYCGNLTICNVAQSSMVREAESAFLTHAGPEIGVASTKAFTTQLVALFMLALMIGKHREAISTEDYKKQVKQLNSLPNLIRQFLALDKIISSLAATFADKRHALFLGRGILFPIALEGALKLKEISYIHAEAYPAGELKHGPLALVDHDMPVVVLAPDDDLLNKLKANIQEVQARGGRLIVFAPKAAELQSQAGITVINVPDVPRLLAPIAFSIPMQLLSYYAGVHKGTDVDQPRNLAKSVTVE